MLPLYERLSHKSLLKRCVSGLTQNQNEFFNATIWKRCTKERYFGAATIKRAHAMLVVTRNVGRQDLVSVFEHLQLPTNIFTLKALGLKEKKRIMSSQRCATIKKRKVSKALERGDYVPGND